MPPPQGRPQAPQFIVFWIIWFAIFSGLVILQFFIGGGVPSGSPQGDGPLLIPVIAFGMAVVAVFVRFGVLPRIKELEKKLPLMIVGLALSEGVGILGMLAVPAPFGATKLLLLAVSLICIILQAPVYAKPPGGGNPFVNGAP